VEVEDVDLNCLVATGGEALAVGGKGHTPNSRFLPRVERSARITST
jgi:hypothetical protein